MVVGKYLDAGGGDTGMHLQGYLDEFYIFDEVRDESNVKKLMDKCDFPTGGKSVYFFFPVPSLALAILPLAFSTRTEARGGYDDL